MIIDIRKDVPAFQKYLRERIAAHLTGPDGKEPVSRVQFGFEFGQANWVAACARHTTGRRTRRRVDLGYRRDGRGESSVRAAGLADLA